jgi:hypothetical protein
VADNEKTVQNTERERWDGEEVHHRIPTAAKLMSTTVFAVRELYRSRELAYVVIGQKWLLSPGAIRAFI